MLIDEYYFQVDKSLNGRKIKRVQTGGLDLQLPISNRREEEFNLEKNVVYDKIQHTSAAIVNTTANCAYNNP